MKKCPASVKQHFPILRARGFKTVGDIANASQDYLATLLGKYGIALWEKANGEGSTHFSTEHERKSISKERTFGEDIVNKEKIESILFGLVEEACQLLRNENWQTSTVSIKLRYSDFVTWTRSKTIKATDDDKTVFDVAIDLFRKAYTRRVGVRLIGIHLGKLEHFTEQGLLFEDEETIRKRMVRAVMKIRDKFGFDVIHMGKNV
ncbi:MAG: hypothetical protein U5K00_22500 [Melioribacteraceae bacterium]|nr:hypothetical protein [Melioribacteraceae bacterium]